MVGLPHFLFCRIDIPSVLCCPKKTLKEKNNFLPPNLNWHHDHSLTFVAVSSVLNFYRLSWIAWR